MPDIQGLDLSRMTRKRLDCADDPHDRLPDRDGRRMEDGVGAQDAAADHPTSLGGE